MTKAHATSQGSLPDKSQLKEFGADNIKDNTVTDFDLFLLIAELPTMYARAPYRWAKDELERLLKSGHRTLYYDTRDTLKVEAYKKSVAIPLNFLNEEPRK